MTEKVDLLGTQPKHEQLDVQPCILPLVVLFSIAAQGNRANRVGKRRVGYGYAGRPGVVPMIGPGIGAIGRRRRSIYPMAPMPGMNVRRRGLY
jgi:hypothetical protein